VSSFLNAHIKAELLDHLKQARSQNVRIPNMTVGADPVIQQLVRFANKKQAATIRELQLDIQSGIDSRISEEESQSMLLMAARISMPNRGKVITTDSLSLHAPTLYLLQQWEEEKIATIRNYSNVLTALWKLLDQPAWFVHFLFATKPNTNTMGWLKGYMNVGGMLPKEGRLQIGCAEWRQALRLFWHALTKNRLNISFVNDPLIIPKWPSEDTLQLHGRLNATKQD
jgi:hypothetical protein